MSVLQAAGWCWWWWWRGVKAHVCSRRLLARTVPGVATHHVDKVSLLHPLIDIYCSVDPIKSRSRCWISLESAFRLQTDTRLVPAERPHSGTHES